MSEPPDAPLVNKLDKLCDRIFAALERGPGVGRVTAPRDPAPEPEPEPETVHYSRGRDKYDAHPEQRTAASFEAFAEAVLSDRSTAKGLTWIAAPFKPNSDGRHHRCKDGALPRRFLALDWDGSTPDAFAEVCMYIAAYRGFGYLTASHTPACPRARFILELSRPVDRAEGTRLGEAMQRQIEARLGLGVVKLDPSVYRGEQPIYGPLVGAEVMRYDGDPVEVDEVLKEAPPLEEMPGRAERAAAIASRDPVVRMLAHLKLIKRDHGDGKLSIICPFENSHTEPGGESSTVYFLPNFGGVRYGKFVCKHTHCGGRQQEDYLTALGLDPREAWRAQAGGAAPYDDPVGSYGEADQEDARRHTAGEKASAEGQTGPSNGAAPGGAKAEGGEEWSDPQPIQAPLHPVPAFDSKTMLPEALRDWISDEADRMPCPPDFIAAAVLVELGAIVGARCAIKPKAKDDWLIVPNLWGGIVALVSAKKSPAIDAALKPLGRLIALAMEAYRADMEAFEVDKVAFEAKEEAIKVRIKAVAKDAKKGNMGSIVKELQSLRQQAPEAPILRRYKTNDTTVEKLGELLRENPNGLLVLRDELVGLVASWEKEGHEGDRAFFLEGWNGNASFDTDRIKRGSIFIPNLCVSIFGGIQPDKLTGYLEQATHALANDGMLQRFQVLVYPNPRKWEWVNRDPDKKARDRAVAVFDALADFDPVVWGAAPADGFAKFPCFFFDDEAQQIFIEWSYELHRTRLPAEENPIIAQHLAKYDKLFPALALILHLVECAATGQRGPVTKAAALRAAGWCEYLESHARRCYGLLADDGLRSAQALAEKVSQGKLSDGFTARDVRRNQWRYLTVDEAIQAALDWLEDEGWLRADQVGGTGPGTGRRTWRYFVNPKAVRPDKPGGGDHG